MTTHGIKFEVNAASAKKGASEFTTAINSISAAIIKLEKTSTTAFAKMDKGFKGDSFKQFNRTVKEFNATKVSAQTLTNITTLSMAVKDFRSPTTAQSKRLSSFALALKKIQSPKGAPAITKLANALSRFKPPTPRQTTNLVNFVKALHGLRVPANANAIAAALDRITGSATRASTSLKGLRGTVSTIGLRKLSKESKQASVSMNGLGNSFNIAHQGGTILRSVLGHMTLGAFSKSVFEASNAVQTFNVTMETVSGSASSARTDLAFVRKMASDLAIDLRTAQEQYASFAAASKVAGLESETTRDIFKSVSIAMTVLNRSTQDQELSFLALQQMISKGTVSSEELRRQLGERLPGALEIMARSLGVSGAELNKMLKAGSILSKEALPKFAKELEKIFGAGVPAALKRTSSQLKLLRNDFETVLLDIGDAGFMDALTDGVKEFRGAIDSPEFKQFTKDLGKGLGNAIEAVASGMSALVKNADILKAAIQGFLILKTIGLLKTLGLRIFEWGSKALVAGRAQALANASMVGTRAAALGATVSVSALSVSLRTLWVALGPVGLIFIGVNAAMMAYDALTEDSKESTESFANVLDTLGKSAESAAVSLEEMSRVEIQLLQLDLAQAIPEAKKNLKDAIQELNDVLEGGDLTFNFVTGIGLTGSVFDELTGAVKDRVRELSSQFKEGDISAEDLLTSLNALGTADPKVKEITLELKGYIKKLISASEESEALASHKKSLKEALIRLLEPIKEVASSVDDMDSSFKGTKKQVADFTKTLGKLSETGKLVSAIDSLVKANDNYNVSLAKSPIKEYENQLVDLDAIIQGYGKNIKNLSDEEKSASEVRIALKDNVDGLIKSQKQGKDVINELVRAETELAGIDSKILELSDSKSKAQANLAKEIKNQEEATNSLAAAQVNEAAILQDSIEDTRALGRETRLLVSEALSKVAPELSKNIIQTDLMANAQELLNAVVKLFPEHAEAAEKAMEDYGVKLGTAATAGIRAAKILEDVQKKIKSDITKKELSGEELAEFTATDKFKAAGEDIQKELDIALKSGIQTNIDIAQSAMDEYNDAMSILSEEAAESFKFKVAKPSSRFSDEMALVKALASETDNLSTSKAKLSDLQDLLAMTGIKEAAAAKIAGLSIEEYNQALIDSIALKEDDTSEFLLGQLDEEAKLLRMTEQARQLANAMRAEEAKWLKLGIDLTLKQNAAKREEVRLAVFRNNELAKAPTGINATLASIKSLDEALADVGETVSKDLIDAFAELATKGTFDFKKMADSIIADLARIAAQQVFKAIFGKAIKIGLSSFFGSGKEGGISGSLPGRESAPLSSFVGAPHFAQGTANTSGGIPSILHDNEAVIPLSQNRKVPVEINGAGGGAVHNTVNNYFDIDVEGSDEAVEEKITMALSQAAPKIVQASRLASMEDTQEFITRRKI